MAKARKWYVVWVGRTPGIYTTWAECEREVKGFPSARYKSFPSQEIALQAFAKTAKAPAPKASASLPAKKPAAKKPKAPAQTTQSAVDVEIFCDGACDPNPGPSGSGVVVYRLGVLSDLYYGHFAPMGTNNTAELLALQESLSLAKTALSEGQSVRIRADSQYAIKCISQWASGWKKRGWRRPNNDPVKNQVIVEAAYNLYCDIGHAIDLVHVKAHAGIEGNELADRMAMKASLERQGAFVKYPGTLNAEEILRLQRG